jgi:hypothetical protein
MIDAVDESASRQFVKRHRVHYSVEPEWMIAEDARWPVGFSIRFFAGHDRRARALPGGPESRALLASLRSLAESLLRECGTTARVEVEPFRPVLYESTEVPGTDEVALTIRVLREFAPHLPPSGASEAYCLQEIRKRARLIALPER